MILVGLSGAGLTALVRRGTQWRFDRLFVGGHVGHDEAIMESTRHMMEVLDLNELGRSIADLCQRALESSYVAILLPDAEGKRLALSHVSGPFPQPRPEWTISRDSALLAAITQVGEVATTLFALAPLLDSGATNEADARSSRRTAIA